jgi:putative tryptophan/tyrosine transport system substrate-binding protein
MASHIGRRKFLAALGGAPAAWPLAAHAQQAERMRRVGVLMAFAENDPEGKIRATVFERALQDLGWTSGRNIRIDYRWMPGDVEQTRAAAAELLKLAPDVILAHATPMTAALHQATPTVPVVFVVVSEPVAQGFVQSLAHPGGNMTGFTNVEPTLGAKWLELLKEIASRVARVAVLYNSNTAPYATLYFHSTELVAEKMAVELITAPVHEPAEIEAALTRLGREPGGGLILPPDPFTVAHRKLIFDLAARYRVPAISALRYLSNEGCLLSYGVDVRDQFRQGAAYIDRILRGEKPADLPVQQPTKFELVINLKTAKMLGIDVPPTLLARADEVIE